MTGDLQQNRIYLALAWAFVELSSVGLRKFSSGFSIVLWLMVLITLVHMGVYLQEDFVFSFSHPCQ